MTYSWYKDESLVTSETVGMLWLLKLQLDYLLPLSSIQHLLAGGWLVKDHNG